MTLLFPDLNVWLALSVAGHSHGVEAWEWVRELPRDAKLVFCRYTQIGLLRLLTNGAVMGDQTLVLREAWGVYDSWLADPRVEFYPEPRNLDASFRLATEAFAARPASKAVGDCFLLAYGAELRATLVTFDKALYQSAQEQGCSALVPGRMRR